MIVNYLPYIFCGLLLIAIIYFVFSSSEKKKIEEDKKEEKKDDKKDYKKDDKKEEKKDDKKEEKEEKKDPVYENAVKLLNFKITSIETYADTGNVQQISVNKTTPPTPSPQELKKQNEEALKRQIEEEKRVYSKFTREQIDQILRNILISPTSVKIGNQEVPSMRIIFKEMLGGKDPYVCYKVIPQGIDINKLNDILNIMMIEPLIKALKESNSTYLGIIALFKYKLFSLLLPPDIISFSYNEKNKTFRLSLQGKPMTLAELTSPSLREFSLNITPNFLPFDKDREKTRLLPQSIKLIETARQYYNNHSEIALRLQSYKTNNTLDIPLQAVEDSNILMLSNMYLNNPQLNQFNMRCDLPYDF